MRRPDVVVVGVGRSGTSFTAKVLHEDLGVYMGSKEVFKFTGPKGAHPDGTYEDTRLNEYTYRQVEVHGISMDVWLGKYDSYYRSIAGPVGIKNPATSLFLYEQWKELAPKLVVRTWRPKDLTVASMLRWRGKTIKLDHWERFYDQREVTMKTQLDTPQHAFPVVRVEFGKERKPKEEIIELLQPYIDDIKDKYYGP
jgi:hypothetical protein